jgi:hypothetical protein
MRYMRRMRVSAISAGVAFTVAFALLALLVSQSLFLVLPVVLAGWYTWYLPWWKRRVRQRARSLPTWKLRPE